MPSPLDPFIPAPDVRERFEIVVRAPAAEVMAAARGFDMQSVPLVRLIFGLRERILGARKVSRAARGLVAETSALGWGVLCEEPGSLYVAGAHCRPWEADVRFRPIPADAFADWNERGEVKIAWTLEAIAVGPELTRLVTETRAVATDAEARRRFRRYWRWARFGIVAIRWLLLPAVRRQVEGTWRPAAPAEGGHR